MVLVTDVYEFEEIIGEGSFSNVVSATHNETQKKYAIKIIDKAKIITDVQRERVDREIAILKMCNHPNIVRLSETFESDEEISLVMELMKGGDLFSRITSQGTMSEGSARSVMKSVFAAVDFLHDRSLVHRDLKPENLLYTSDDENALLKLSDFGLSKFSNERENEGLQTPCGTIAYTAPEITNMKVYRKSVDIWSCGCILYFMLFGRPPFYSEDEEEIYDLVSQGIWSFPENHLASDIAKDLVSKLLEKDPIKRLTVKQAIQHPFLTQKEQSQAPTTARSLLFSPDISSSSVSSSSSLSPSLLASDLSLPSQPSPTPSFIFSGPPSPSISSSSSLSLNSPSSSSPSPLSLSSSSLSSLPCNNITPTSSIAIPHLRASMHSAMDAQRGPLTPPLISPLESNIWKKRAKTRALLQNNTADIPLDLLASSSPAASYEDKEGFSKRLENENNNDINNINNNSDAMDMDMGMTYQ